MILKVCCLEKPNASRIGRLSAPLFNSGGVSGKLVGRQRERGWNMAAPKDDPVYKSSLREFWVVLATWLILCVYTLTFCHVRGYDLMSDEIACTWGVPDWALYGVIAPWLLCNVFSFWFCFRFIEDGELESPEEDPSGAASRKTRDR